MVPGRARLVGEPLARRRPVRVEVTQEQWSTSVPAGVGRAEQHLVEALAADPRVDIEQRDDPETKGARHPGRERRGQDPATRVAMVPPVGMVRPMTTPEAKPRPARAPG